MNEDKQHSFPSRVYTPPNRPTSDDVLLYVVYYLAAGVVVGMILDLGLGLFSADTTAEVFGVTLLWPLFVIKYLAIGIWMVLSSGFSILFS